MEWTREKTLKLVELLQTNAPLWNPTVSESRRDKQKRKEELRRIASQFSISVVDVAKKIQHLRTQYNREAAREARVKADDPDDHYTSNWYAFEYLHFLKDSTKPFRVLMEPEDYPEEITSALQKGDLTLSEGKPIPRSLPCKVPRIESVTTIAAQLEPPLSKRDEFSVFGEYVANELRSLKGEKNLIIAKKKIQDAIFEVKMGSMHNLPPLQTTPEHHAAHHQTLLTPHTHNPPTTNMSEISSIIHNCHYTNFKVDQQ